MNLPVIGAALAVEELETCRSWILEKHRDLELQNFASAEVLKGDWQPLVDEALRLLDGYRGRLGIHGPFWGFSIASQDKDVRNIVGQRMKQGLDVCKALAATQMVIHSPFTTWDHHNLPGNRAGFDQIVDLTHATLGVAVQRAEDLGVVLVIENIEDIDPIHRLKLANSFNSPAVKLSIDTGHAQYAHYSTGAVPVDYFVSNAGSFLHHIHLQDADGYADRHWAIGEGNIPWQAVFRAIRNLEGHPRLILELRDKDGISASMAYLEMLGLGQ